ncbi:MAG: DUF2846 domain-containing protein [Zoogloeaceae bacterium]|jgi:hypothetical protein|nr:DUF2846 domain-containing protein [Zoogloeaceae bacterium]
MKRATWTPFVAAAIGALSGRILAENMDMDADSMKWLLGLAFLSLGIFVYCVVLGIRHNKKIIKASAKEREKALEFQPVTGKGALYLFRCQIAGAFAGRDLILDGVFLGQTRGLSFYLLELEPGKHRLESDKGCLTPLEVEVAAGEIVFVEQELLRGLWRTARHFLLQKDNMETRWRLRECKMLLPSQSKT